MGLIVKLKTQSCRGNVGCVRLFVSFTLQSLDLIYVALVWWLLKYISLQSAKTSMYFDRSLELYDKLYLIFFSETLLLSVTALRL